MLCFILISFICSTGNPSKAETSFTFLSNNLKEVTFVNPQKYIKKNKVKKELNSVPGYETNEPRNSGWYYVHFLIDDTSEIKNYINIQNQNKLIKDTFLLYLHQDQLSKISNISLIKRIEPNEKYNENGLSIDKTDYLIVCACSKFKVPILNDYYFIENELTDGIYIIQFIQYELNDKSFIIMKKKVIKSLSKIPEIKSISTLAKPVLQNALATGFTQKNSFDFKFNNLSNFYYTDRHINNKGITGKNQIVTLIDSPIDLYHEMFHDDDVEVKLNTHMPNHRKIVYYHFNGSLDDYVNELHDGEHGTHVAGTIAGKSICTNDEKGTSFFNGIAPDAKIIYAGTLYDQTTFEIFEILLEQFNSKISSNSYGFMTYRGWKKSLRLLFFYI